MLIFCRQRCCGGESKRPEAHCCFVSGGSLFGSSVRYSCSPRTLHAGRTTGRTTAAWMCTPSRSWDLRTTMTRSIPTITSRSVYVFSSTSYNTRLSGPLQTAFKAYINAFVSRYADEPTILAWELANEPRCRGSPGCVQHDLCHHPTPFQLT